MQLSLCLFCFSVALNVFSVYYNYFDFRYHWDALEISLFYSAFGVLLALTTGVGIRYLIPKRLSESRGVLVGFFLQVHAVPYRTAWYHSFCVFEVCVKRLK